MMFPLVSIIIPTYNRADLISETINSAINQSYSNLEILIIDDHSKDNTESIVDNFIKIDNRVRFYRSPLSKPKGANSCRNYGFSICNGEYVKWIDSDDVLAVDTIEKQLNLIVEENADLCICRTQKFIIQNGTTFVEKGEWGGIVQNPTPEQFILKGFNWHTSSGLWSKKYFKSDLIWDEQLMNSQEWLMHFTQLCRGVRIVKVYEFLAFARLHKNNMSNSSHKGGEYYYNQCLARAKAFDVIQEYEILNRHIRKRIAKQFNWYYLFVFYKGSLLLGLRLLPKYIYFILVYLK